jgi:hypothetical protein
LLRPSYPGVRIKVLYLVRDFHEPKYALISLPIGLDNPVTSLVYYPRKVLRLRETPYQITLKPLPFFTGSEPARLWRACPPWRAGVSLTLSR